MAASEMHTMRPAGPQADAAAEPTGEDFKKAVSVLLPYLLSHRTRLASLEDSSSGTQHSTEPAPPGDLFIGTILRAGALRHTDIHAYEEDVAALMCIGSVWRASAVYTRILLNGCRVAL